MKKTAKLQDIIDGMEMQFEGTNTYLNLKTGEVVSVSQEDLRSAEEDEPPMDHLKDWQQENMKIAMDVVENYEDYEELPTTYEINEYEMMEDFCFTLVNEKHKSALLEAIRGKGAFSRFKDEIRYLGIEEEWYAHRDESYKQKAIEWCEDHNVDYAK